jgi:hypothetical protein
MHKDVLRRIRNGFDSTTYLDQALAVYTVHCELASNAESPSYAATRRKIAERAGVSLRRVADIHNRFRSLMILDWKQQQIAGTFELGENFYSLLMSGTPCPRSGREAKRGNCTVVEQSHEESIERLNDATDKPAPGPVIPALTVHRSKTALSRGKEDELMGRLRTLLGEDEMARSGGDWRVNWVRECPALLERGLNDLNSTIKEGRILIRNRAAFLHDWLDRAMGKK